VKRFLVIILFFSAFLNLRAQEGNYYINNFTPSTYGASDQNWCVTQDSLGRLFVANLNGVLVYDGEYWKVILITDAKECVSLAKSDRGVIYAGGSGEFGYLDNDRNGKFKYNSLSASLPAKEKEFGNVWAIHSIGKNIFFCSNERIFWYENNEYKKSFTPTGEKFHTFFNMGSTLMVREQGVGLSFFSNGSLKKILGSGELADVRVYSVLHQKDHLYWLCSRKGLYTLYFNINKPEISNLVKVNSPIDNWMIENDIYCGTKLNDNLFALGSIKKGAILVDQNYKIVNHISYEKGLQDDAVKYIYKDYSGHIWLALNKGLSYVEINSPITFLGKSNGVSSTIESIGKLNNTIYIATDKGVQFFNKKTNVFEHTEINEESLCLNTVGKKMFAGTSTGIYLIDESGIRRLANIKTIVYKIFILPEDNSYMYLSTESGLLFAKYNGKELEILKAYNNTEIIESFAPDKNKCAFFGTRSKTIYLLDPQKPDTLLPLSLDGLVKNANYETRTASYNGTVVIVCDEGIFSPVNYPNVKIIKEKKYDVPELKFLNLYYCIPSKNDIWLSSTILSDVYHIKDFPVFTILQPPTASDKKFTYKEKHFLYRIRGVSRVHCTLNDSGHVFLGTENGLFIYDENKKENFYEFNTFISRIRINNDTLENFTSHTSAPQIQIKYKDHKINFLAAASDYYNMKLLEFSYYLEGRDTLYGDWTLNKEINYSNLNEGSYTFHLKSRNILGVEGKPVSFSFTILPPWYRTYWAYALYLLGSISLIWFIVAYNTRRLKEQNIKLEKIITERTKEIEHQKEEIEHKNQEITDSINYAKRIQQAILPPVAEITKVWRNLFVFYQPKDIVSGDFYWFHKISNEEILIACADCTGHGVPGGFMSMICSDKLNDAVKETLEPAKILFHVNNNVKKALRQTETSDENVNKDGMEISLVRINFATHKVWFAGANRPLWLIKSGSEEIEEIKPTKASIASFTQTDFEYQGHELQLEKNDLVYLTSDGYPDQFGGADGKKFMTKNFKKLILSIKQLGIPEQESTIRNVINQWKEGYEQVDDLLVIAFRL
jgi:serine phosphatase RsbU (regulator of sigma subunit)/ligand-binding sensor domain-containing protein